MSQKSSSSDFVVYDLQFLEENIFCQVYCFVLGVSLEAKEVANPECDEFLCRDSVRFTRMLSQTGLFKLQLKSRGAL